MPSGGRTARRERSTSPKTRYTRTNMATTTTTTTETRHRAVATRDRDGGRRPASPADGARNARHARKADAASSGKRWGASGSDGATLCALVIFRVVSAFVVRTSFVPDEYWQSLEVAHRVAFGYGHLTWEWREAIRGALYPGAIAAVYRLLSLVGADSRAALVLLPRVLQGALSAYGDYHVLVLARRLFGDGAGRWALAAHCASWFGFYAAPRTLTNTAEAALTAVALARFPWPAACLHRDGRREGAPPPPPHEFAYLRAAALACLVRPTAAVTWAPLCAWHAWSSRGRVRAMLRGFAPVAAAALVVAATTDRLVYGRWTSSHYNFLHFNVLRDLGATYGTHPWHWYVTQGLPAVAPAHIVPACVGAARSHNALPALLLAWHVAALSIPAHKEFRFLLPVLPLVSVYVGHLLDSLATPATPGGGRRKLAVSLLLGWLIVADAPLALYTSVVHQQGALAIMEHVASVAGGRQGAPPASVLFLMPCHSTPFYSHVHANATMRFLTCEPNLEGAADYEDEADRFYRAPLLWLGRHASPPRPLPTHVVMFDALAPRVEVWLGKYGFAECARVFHTHFPDGRVGSQIHMYCRR
ncbi:PREDICTED: GPI mannosyltransferase 3-like [Priapulus caudatus]|uniref:Mannosyltransferase n=1 Tax=Priapulus caudatus TaxID=37621 RepID=A0ABM1EEB9_PRICU|nr:PREDICTED: GPI mannosyltransferase 3-like [Priapulus caudatus]